MNQATTILTCSGCDKVTVSLFLRCREFLVGDLFQSSSDDLRQYFDPVHSCTRVEKSRSGLDATSEHK